MATLLSPLLRLLFPGRHGRFVFTSQPVSPPTHPDSLNLYVHLPFCRRICPFCPYVKQTYERDTADAYRAALLRELDMWQSEWKSVPLASVYFGGGTPSMTPDIVDAVLSSVSSRLQPGAPVGVEVHPLDARPSVLASLRSSGVTMLSVGVQSFDDDVLRVLGRNYDGSTARNACSRALAAGFQTVDIDLIFAIPGQSTAAAARDVDEAISTGAGQVSAYPLIRFADTAFGATVGTRQAQPPSRRVQQDMLCTVVQQAGAAGYNRSSIWSFNRPGAARYTTVTREQFLGIGAGASSQMGEWFWLNTFSVPEYIRVAGSGKPPALATRLNEGDRMAYWFFWRCYDTVIDAARFRESFGRDLPGVVRVTLALLHKAGVVRWEGDTIRLTDRGAYLFHLIEQYYTHAYLEPLWAACRREAWPGPVRL